VSKTESDLEKRSLFFLLSYSIDEDNNNNSMMTSTRPRSPNPIVSGSTAKSAQGLRMYYIIIVTHKRTSNAFYVAQPKYLCYVYFTALKVAVGKKENYRKIAIQPLQIYVNILYIYIVVVRTYSEQCENENCPHRRAYTYTERIYIYI